MTANRFENDFDSDEPDWGAPSKNLWVASAAIYHIDKLSDDDMEYHFPNNDGKWSAQTKQAIVKFNAMGLDLNENWALLSKGWQCPSCDRTKMEIFRINEAGILLANAHLHHDHIGEYLKDRVREICGIEWSKTAPAEALRAISSLTQLSESFDATYICWECNTIEGNAKGLITGKPINNFSFSPSEINSFIAPRKNKPPLIDERKLHVLWAQYSEILHRKIEFIDTAIYLIKSGVFKKEASPRGINRIAHVPNGERNLVESFFRQNRAGPEARRIYEFSQDFKARSTSKDSDRLKTEKREKKRHCARINEEDLSRYVDTQSPKTWGSLSINWSCPICNRSKYDVIRRSKTGKLTGGVRSLAVPILETDPSAILMRRKIAPRFAPDVIIRSEDECKICSDCRDIITKLKTTRMDIGDIHLDKDEIAKCLIENDPHFEHIVDWVKAGNFAKKNTYLSHAWEEYIFFRTAVSTISSAYSIMTRNAGEREARRDAITRTSIELHIFDDAEIEILLPFILSEGARLRQHYDAMQRDNSCPGTASSKP